MLRQQNCIKGNRNIFLLKLVHRQQKAIFQLKGKTNILWNKVTNALTGTTEPIMKNVRTVRKK